MPKLNHVLVVAVTGLVCLSAESASTYERTKTCGTFGAPECRRGEEPTPIRWPVRCVEYRLNERGSDDFPQDPGGQPGQKLRSLVERSFQAWNDVSCADFTMIPGDLTETTRVEYDPAAGFEGNENVIVWREDRWPYASRSTFALSSVTFHAKTANIRDVDIEFNGVVHEFADLGSKSQTDRVDLRNVLTHEAGHFLGLAHSTVAAATMFGSAGTGEVKKRTLHQDDIGGVCEIYADTGAPTSCDDPEDFRLPPQPDTGGSQFADASGDAGRADPPDGTRSDCGCRAATGTTTSPVILLACCIVLAASRVRRAVRSV